MMNYEQIKAMAEVLVNNDDAYARYNEDNICVTLNDCNSDEEEWEYNNEKTVDAFMKALENNCIKVKHDWGRDCYTYDYTFDNFVVNIRYFST